MTEDATIRKRPFFEIMMMFTLALLTVLVIATWYGLTTPEGGRERILQLMGVVGILLAVVVLDKEVGQYLKVKEEEGAITIVTRIVMFVFRILLIMAVFLIAVDMMSTLNKGEGLFSNGNLASTVIVCAYVIIMVACLFIMTCTKKGRALMEKSDERAKANQIRQAEKNKAMLDNPEEYPDVLIPVGALQFKGYVRPKIYLLRAFVTLLGVMLIIAGYLMYASFVNPDIVVIWPYFGTALIWVCIHLDVRMYLACEHHAGHISASHVKRVIAGMYVGGGIAGVASTYPVLLMEGWDVFCNNLLASVVLMALLSFTYYMVFIKSDSTIWKN